MITYVKGFGIEMKPIKGECFTLKLDMREVNSLIFFYYDLTPVVL